MKTILRNIVVVGIMALIQSCGSSQQVTGEQSVDAIMSEFTLPNNPGATVLVMRNDSVIFSKAYGLASVRDSVPVTVRTNFRLASITKQFTAMSILILQKNGSLSLDDKILKFFPDFPLYGKDITVRHLLSHTSGLVDYESLIPDSQTVQVLDADCLQLMHRVDSLYFAPGSRYQYSNTGYALLALIVEKVSGQRFADFLKKNIFDIVGMPTSVAFENGISSVQHRAYGHSFVNGAWIETDQSNTSAVLGDGGIYSNVVELSKWISTLWKYSLISEEMQLLAWADAVLNDGSAVDYGLGWHKEVFRGIRHPHHGGSTRGFRNHMLLFPETKSMVVILSNRNQGEPIGIAKKIADLFLPLD